MAFAPNSVDLGLARALEPVGLHILEFHELVLRGKGAENVRRVEQILDAVNLLAPGTSGGR